MKNSYFEKFEKVMYVLVKVVSCLMMIWTVVCFLKPDILIWSGYEGIMEIENDNICMGIIYGASVLALAILCRKNKQ